MSYIKEPNKPDLRVNQIDTVMFVRDCSDYFAHVLFNSTYDNNTFSTYEICTDCANELVNDSSKLEFKHRIGLL